MANYILVHGGWGGSWQYDEIAPVLQKNGHNISILDCPGMNCTGKNPVDLYDHVKYISQFIRSNSEPSIVAAFSFGGIASTIACCRLSNSIKKLIYLDAFLPLPGESFMDIIGDKLKRQIKAYTDNFDIDDNLPPFFEDGCHVTHPYKTLITKADYNISILKKINPIYIRFTNKRENWSFTNSLKKQYAKAKKLDFHLMDIKADHILTGDHSQEIAALLNNI